MDVSFSGIPKRTCGALSHVDCHVLVSTVVAGNDRHWQHSASKTINV